MLGRRLLSALVGIPVVVGIVSFGPPWLFAAFVLALVAGGQWELYRMFGEIGVAADRGAGLFLGGLVVLAFAGGASRAGLVPLALSLAVCGCLALGLRRVGDAGRDWAGVALTLLGVCYCAWLLGHALWLRALPGGPALTLVGLGVTWCGESAAYFAGRRWGRHKLAPRISPGKTVEGAVAQLVVTVATALAAVGLVDLAPLHALGLGLLLGTVGQVGDLTESFLKRSAQTKDAGDLLPGHGGLLDRLDSLLFNVPALYYYAKLLLGQG